MHNKPLGRRIPTSWTHYDKFPLTAETIPDQPAPVAIGINWYEDFDNPVEKDGRYWIGLDSKNLGKVRGGHCVCLEPGDALDGQHHITRREQDKIGWYEFYNQGAEGACVGFGCSRMMSLLNRRLYDARWLWDQAKIADEWSDTNPGDDNGTSVRAACSVLVAKGHVLWRKGFEGRDFSQRAQETPDSNEGITAYRWASTVDQTREVLKSPHNDKLGAVRILNSWGEDYPHRVWMPYETLDRIIAENGEVALVTDQ